MTDQAAPAHTPTRDRLIELDVLRGIALIGVCVMNYHGYLLNRSGDQAATGFFDRVFDPWQGPLSTRFAAVFVTVAGMGVALMSAKARAARDRAAISEVRRTLVRRGVLLYLVGYFLNWVWPGTILLYYGAFFLLAALLFTLRDRWLAVIGGAAVLAAAAVQWWALDRETNGHDADWLLYGPETARQALDLGEIIDHLDMHSPREQLLYTVLRGTHPILPWLAFFCLGIALGRRLPFSQLTRYYMAFIGGTLLAVGYIARRALPVHELLRSTSPFDRGVLYMVTAVGSTLLAVSLPKWLPTRTAASRPTLALADTGRTTLTLYVAHALVFNLVVDWLGWVHPGGLSTSLLFAFCFWCVAVMFATLLHQRFRNGPLEAAYRWFS